MGRGSEPASTAATSAQNISNVSGGNAGALYSTLAPALESQMANPQGFNPVDLARMDTATMQTAGGTQSAAVGAGSLRAARTGNVGGSDAAIADAARKGGEIASEGALGTQIKNAQLKQHQRDQAASGLQGLYGGERGASVGALGQVASNVNADTNAENASWDWTKGVDSVGNLLGNASKSFKPICWVAEAIYGVDDPRTHLLRAWLNGPFKETRFGGAVMALYLAIGRQVAWVARRSAFLRWALKPLFEMGLREAAK